jgi:hypothetical protein
VTVGGVGVVPVTVREPSGQGSGVSLYFNEAVLGAQGNPQYRSNCDGWTCARNLAGRCESYKIVVPVIGTVVVCLLGDNTVFGSIPNFFIRVMKLVRFKPRRAAAP